MKNTSTRDAQKVPKPTWKMVNSDSHPPCLTWIGLFSRRGRGQSHSQLPVQWSGSRQLPRLGGMQERGLKHAVSPKSPIPRVLPLVASPLCLELEVVKVCLHSPSTFLRTGLASMQIISGLWNTFGG